jgi:hypothetical protein
MGMGFPHFTATSVTPTKPTTHMAPLIQKLRRHMTRWFFSSRSGTSAGRLDVSRQEDDARFESLPDPHA